MKVSRAFSMDSELLRELERMAQTKRRNLSEQVRVSLALGLEAERNSDREIEEQTQREMEKILQARKAGK